MDNATFLEELKFGVGDGYLHYYFYNYHLQNRLVPGELGIILV
jgi:glycylpeptide N-tetradecanoyltransferase